MNQNDVIETYVGLCEKAIMAKKLGNLDLYKAVTLKKDEFANLNNIDSETIQALSFLG